MAVCSQMSRVEVKEEDRTLSGEQWSDNSPSKAIFLLGLSPGGVSKKWSWYFSIDPGGRKKGKQYSCACFFVNVSTWLSFVMILEKGLLHLHLSKASGTTSE